MTFVTAAPAPTTRRRGTGLPVLAVALGLALGGCGGSQVRPTITAEAEQIYFDGMEHLAGGALIEAEQEFMKLLKMPSYVPLVPLARLRLGDAQFHQAKYNEAIETYLSFAQRHDGSENVPYALFMAAKAQFELAPDELWFMPPIYELDLTAWHSARRALERFVRSYPRSRYATEAIELRDKTVDVQWQHDRYVIEFYREREQWIGVVFRLHQAIQQFPTRGHTLEHYTLLAESYGKLAWRQRAVEMWQAIHRRWPGTAEARRAANEIQRLKTAIAAAKKAGDPAAEMPAELPPTAELEPETWSEVELDT